MLVYKTSTVLWEHKWELGDERFRATVLQGLLIIERPVELNSSSISAK